MIRVRPANRTQDLVQQTYRLVTLRAVGAGANTAGRGRCRSGFFASLAVSTVIGLSIFGTAPAFAQNANLNRQVEQLREDLDLLQRYVYREGVPEGAAAVSGGASSTPAAARQQVQINDIERTVTQLTGQIEQFDFRIRKIEDRLDRLVSDVDFRLSQLESGGALGAAQQSDDATGDNRASAPVTNGNQAAADGDNRARTGDGEVLKDDGTRLFGVIESEGQAPQIPSGPANSRSSAAGSAPVGQTAAASNLTPEEEYRKAFDLLRRQEFAQAENALSSFVRDYPENPLAGNAQYWLGETYYVRGDFERAAVAFTEGFQTYPDSSKAPDNLLKLGMSLANLGKKEDACTTFGHLIDNFPNASAVVLDRARQERKNRGCS